MAMLWVIMMDGDRCLYDWYRGLETGYKTNPSWPSIFGLALSQIRISSKYRYRFSHLVSKTRIISVCGQIQYWDLIIGYALLSWPFLRTESGFVLTQQRKDTLQCLWQNCKSFYVFVPTQFWVTCLLFHCMYWHWNWRSYKLRELCKCF